ncbi:hypothetical protein F5050DRAFT_1712657 [Lentinula boryana]|uniref:C3H1-type domain-containing protein n=1 Tax=Lentinula boryana TaxID=40481 RepID=A0ABQ8QB78_9AGAR|nr:hypothetical protein F5050DRAFT_1712657 [Lentinula boryana]
MSTASSGKPFDLSNYYASLAFSYNELTLYHEAEAIATRALQLNPTSLRARYSRALARVEKDDLSGAVADIDALFNVDGGKSFPGAKYIHKMLRELLEAKNESSESTLSTRRVSFKDLSWPQPELPAAEPSEEDRHPRNEIAPGQYRNSLACRGHNTKKNKCPHKDCIYSHAPNFNSIRDTEGRNVCLYFLVGCCVRNKSCRYRHSTDGLPTDVIAKPSLDSVFTLQAQWWNDPARMEQVSELMKQRSARRKTEYEIRSKARVNESAAQDEPRVIRAASEEEEKEAQRPDTQTQTRGSDIQFKQLYTTKGRAKILDEKTLSSSRKTSTAVPAKVQSVCSIVEEKGMEKEEQCKAEAANRAAKRDQSDEVDGLVTLKPKKDITTRTPYYPESWTVKSFKKLTNCGFTDDDVADLMEFGVNPWDEYAHSVFAYADDY